jgi:hypothetical protein
LYDEEFPHGWSSSAPREQWTCIQWKYKGETEQGTPYMVEHLGCGIKGLTCKEVLTRTDDKRSTCRECASHSLCNGDGSISAGTHTHGEPPAIWGWGGLICIAGAVLSGRVGCI